MDDTPAAGTELEQRLLPGLSQSRDLATAKVDIDFLNVSIWYTTRTKNGLRLYTLSLLLEAALIV